MIEVYEQEIKEPPFEHCFNCGKTTMHWYEPNDVAVCPDCAKVLSAHDVPTKKQWFEKSK